VLGEEEVETDGSGGSELKIGGRGCGGGRSPSVREEVRSVRMLIGQGSAAVATLCSALRSDQAHSAELAHGDYSYRREREAMKRATSEVQTGDRADWGGEAQWQRQTRGAERTDGNVTAGIRPERTLRQR